MWEDRGVKAVLPALSNSLIPMCDIPALPSHKPRTFVLNLPFSCGSLPIFYQFFIQGGCQVRCFFFICPVASPGQSPSLYKYPFWSSYFHSHLTSAGLRSSRVLFFIYHFHHIILLLEIWHSKSLRT